MKQYPIGIQSFESLIKDGYFYVDKTKLVYRLATTGRYYFLSRPRRFGKSLLLSTLRAYFEGKKELFEGLEIEKLEADWTPHPILHLDLNTQKYAKPDDLDDILNKALEAWEKLYGRNPAEKSLAMRFDGVIKRAHEKTGQRAVILVDARAGVVTQTRRHTFLVSLLGIKHVVLAVNKMDLVDFSKEVYDKIVAEYTAFTSQLGIPDVQCIPLSALDGDNVVEKSSRTPWYTGESLLTHLETVHIGNDHNLTDFRFPVQYVLRPTLDFRGFCGKVASGVIRKGDEVMALPSGKKSRVKSIVTYDGELDYAYPPMSVTLTLEDEIDVSRGEMLVRPDCLPTTGRNFEAMLVWMDEEPMNMDKQFFLKQTTNTSRAKVDSIKYKVDVNTMEQLTEENGKVAKGDMPLKLNQIAHVVMTTAKELFFDPYKDNKATGAFILIDPITNNTSAVGMILNAVDEKDVHNTIEPAVLNLDKLGIAPEHYEAIKTAVKELERQGLAIKLMHNS